MRINVVGTTGSGKSTLARSLAGQLNIPYIEMDALYWRKNWTGISDNELFDRLERELRLESWVLDGNYNRTKAIKWRRVDMVIWVDYGFSRTLWQSVRRAWQRSLRNQELWLGTGNRESFIRSFFSRESILIWMFKTYLPNRQRYQHDIVDPRYGHIRFVRLRSPAQCQEFICTLVAENSAGDRGNTLSQ